MTDINPKGLEAARSAYLRGDSVDVVRRVIAAYLDAAKEAQAVAVAPDFVLWTVSLFRAFARGVAGKDVRDGRMSREIADGWVKHSAEEFQANLIEALSSPPAPASGGVSEAARDVLSERQRQVESEGWTPEHDDKYSHDELPLAAACYAAPEAVYWGPARDRSALRWPWHKDWWKPTNRRRDLVKAGALILAEIERLDRAAALTQPAGKE